MFPIGCVRFARSCGKIYSGRYLFVYGAWDDWLSQVTRISTRVI